MTRALWLSTTFALLAPTPALAQKPSAQPASAAKKWIDVFRGSDLDAMDGAIAKLVGIGAPAVPELTSALADKKNLVRSQSAAALGRIGKASSPAVDALASLLADADDDVRWNACKALGAIGPPARKHAAAIEALTKDKNMYVADEARKAIVSVGK